MSNDHSLTLPIMNICGLFAITHAESCSSPSVFCTPSDACSLVQVLTSPALFDLLVMTLSKSIGTTFVLTNSLCIYLLLNLSLVVDSTQ